MTELQTGLWRKIQAFELDDTTVSFSFTDRLASENAWTLEYALRCVQEYKKFIFLICIADHPLTPSDQVDQVWHLHLLYTRSYWIDFCEQTLQKQIHHGPTKGGANERNKFGDWYEKTVALYKTIFSSAPPEDIWPDQKTRFSDIHFTRVNTKKNWIIPKPSFLRS